MTDKVRRVVVSCLQGLKPHRIAAYIFWRDYFKNGLEEAGTEFLEVPNVDWAEGLTFSTNSKQHAKRWREETWQRTVDFIRTENRSRGVDMFLSYLYPCQVDPGAIEEIKNSGIPCVNFFCDNIRKFTKVPEEYQVFSLHWVPEFDAVELYRKAGLPHLHLPMPCWVPDNLRSMPDAESYPPSFIGTCDPLRMDLFGKTIALGADFRIFGYGWRSKRPESIQPSRPKGLIATVINQFAAINKYGTINFMRKLYGHLFPLRPKQCPESCLEGPLVSNSDFLRVTRESKVTIGVNRVSMAGASIRDVLKYSRLRDIEAPMMGACYLTERCPGIDLLYEPGHEIELYDSAEELRDKLAMLARDPLLRRKLRENGQKRALSDHTVMKSLSKIWNAIR